MTSIERTTQPASDRRPGDPGGPDEKARKVDLSPTQIVGGALAAMTAAALGSRLGVAGTVVGAAAASVVAGVASALYTASLSHASQRVKTVWTSKSAGADEVPTAIDVVPTPEPEHSAPPRALAAGAPRRMQARKKVQWKGMVAGALAAFAVAAVGLTGVELVSGAALSGGQGTTIEQVTKHNQPAPSKPDQPATGDTESESPSQSPTPDNSQDIEPAPTASDEPTTETSSPAGPESAPDENGTSAETDAPNDTSPDEGTPNGGSTGP